MHREAGARELMMMVRGKGAAHHGAGGGKVDRELVCDRAVLDIGDALRREQSCEYVPILPCFGRGQRRKRTNWKAEVESDAIEMARADSGARQNEQAMLLEKLAQFVDDGKDRVRSA